MECKCIYCGETIPEGVPMCCKCAKSLRLEIEYQQKAKEKAIKEYGERKKNDI